MPNLKNAKLGTICAKSYVTMYLYLGFVQTLVKHVPNTCQTCAKHVPNTCQTCAKHMPNMCQTPENHFINIFIQVQKLR